MTELQRRPSALASIAGLSQPVGRRAYVAVGAGLMGFKYGVEALLLLAFTGKAFSPLVYLLPVGGWRLDALIGAPEWLGFAIAAWTLPFVWVGASMSVRRAKDAGLSPLVGLLFFVPFLNYLMIAALSLLPSQERRHGLPLEGGDRQAAAVLAAIAGVVGGSLLAVIPVALFTLLLGDYGAGVFLGPPFLAAALASLLFNLRQDRPVGPSLGVGLLSVAAAGGMLLLFAVEGAICLAMAAPIALVVGSMGALVGREIARIEARQRLIAPSLLLPLLVVAEPPVDDVVHQVSTTVEVDAPPEAVWDTVIAFPPIPADVVPDWYFQLGVAYPLRATIEGEGVGAVRYCEFSTGAFVEPITVWDPPRELSFDVVDNPPTMNELNPWGFVFAPHLEDDILSSRRGQFLLEPLPDGRTRVTGTTWYTFDMGPVWYWTAFSDRIIAAVHTRVLEHVAQVAEGRANR